MSKTLQFRRYNAAVIAVTTGSAGELIVNTDNNTITVHDGSTSGGWQTPTLTYTQAAFATANAANVSSSYQTGINTTQNTSITLASANTIFLSGVDTSQNANIIAVQALANTDYTLLTASAGVYGNSTTVPVITLSANGRVSSIVNTAISGTFTGNVLATGSLTSNNGLYVSNNYTGTYSDGVVIDYVTGNGRISVGSGDQITLYTGGPNTTPVANLYSNGTFTSANVLASSGIGYGAGSGGTVAQITTRTTGVTLNKPAGLITLFSTTMANTTSNTFVLTNSTIAANDFILLNHFSGGTLGNYTFAANTSNGQANVTIRSVATVAAEAPVIQFVVIKGAAS